MDDNIGSSCAEAKVVNLFTQNTNGLIIGNNNSSENAISTCFVQHSDFKDLVPSKLLESPDPAFHIAKPLEDKKDSNSSISIKICLKRANEEEQSDDEQVIIPSSSDSLMTQHSKEKDQRLLSKMRKDVIFKKIVRSCKRYYSQNFRKFVGFGRKAWLKIRKNKQTIFKHANEYLNSLFPGKHSIFMEELLLCFIEKANKKVISDLLDRNLFQELFSMLYYFNTVKLLKLLQKVEFCKLMLNYLNTPDISNEIMKHDADTELINAIEFHINDIKRICRLSIMNNKASE